MSLKNSILLLIFLCPTMSAAQGVPIITETGTEPSSNDSSTSGAKSTGASAQSSTNASSGSTATPPRPLTFLGKLYRGHRQYVDNDHQSALTSYEEAKDMEPANAEGYYFIACAQAKIGRIDDALVTLKTVATLAGGKNDSLQAKALFVSALLEERRGKLDRAREAWKSYLRFAESKRGLKTFPATARGRLQSIEARQQREKEYAVVKERIASANQ